MIRIQFNAASDRRVAVAIRARGPQLMDALEDELGTLMLELQKRIQQKLSGEVLEHRSGKLIASVQREAIQRDANRITGRVTSSGGPAFYGRIQEAGGKRKYEILPRYKKALAFLPSGSVGGAIARSNVPQTPGKGVVRVLYNRSGVKRGELKQSAFGTFGELGGIVVKRVEHPPLPARPFMRTSLLEMQQEIIERIYRRAASVLRT